MRGKVSLKRKSEPKSEFFNIFLLLIIYYSLCARTITITITERSSASDAENAKEFSYIFSASFGILRYYRLSFILAVGP